MIKPIHFAKIIVVFWMLWWVIQFWIDLMGAVAHLGFINTSWARDVNYPYLVKVLSIYPYGPPLAPFLYAGIILWTFIGTVAFIRAAFSLNAPISLWMKRAELAFFITLGLWFAFFLADQLTLSFDAEQNHMVQASFQLLTYFYLLYTWQRKN